MRADRTVLEGKKRKEEKEAKNPKFTRRRFEDTAEQGRGNGERGELNVA